MLFTLQSSCLCLSNFCLIAHQRTVILTLADFGSCNVQMVSFDILQSFAIPISRLRGCPVARMAAQSINNLSFHAWN